MAHSYERHILDLAELPIGVKVLRLTDKTSALWDKFYDDVEREMQPGGALHGHKDWGSKLAGAVARISGLLHYAVHSAEAPGKPIELSTMISATVLGGYFLEHARAALGLMGMDHAVNKAILVLDYLRGKGARVVTARDVMRHKNAVKKVEELEPAFKLLVQRGYLRDCPKITPTTERPPAPVYAVNPKFLYQDSIDNIDIKSDHTGFVSIVNDSKGD